MLNARSRSRVQHDSVESPRVVLIAQRLFDGHRLVYVRHLADMAAQRGDEPVLLLSEEAAGSEEFREHLARAAVRTLLHKDGVASLRQISRFAEQVGADDVVVPDADGFMRELALRGWRARSSLSLLVMRPRAQSGSAGVRSLKSGVKAVYRLAGRARGARVLVLVSALRERVAPNEVRDPVIFGGSAHTARAGSWDLGDGRYWFGVFGAITQRKNLDLIADALAQGVRGEGVGLLVAGRCDSDAMEAARAGLQKFESRGGRVVIDDRLLDDAEFDDALRAVDCVLAVHSNEGASGILARAVLLGTRVVAGGAASLKRDVRDCPGAASWVPLDVTRLSTAIREVTHMSRPDPLSLTEGGSFDRLLRGVHGR